MASAGWFVALLLSGTAAARAEPVTVHELVDGSIITVERYFEDEHELYGWRERVIVDGSIYSLEVDCRDAGGYAERLLHAVIVRDENGRQLHYIEHCRDPVWVDDETIVCNGER